MLDWTYSPYVALFFAFSEEDKTDEKDNPYRVIYIANKQLLEDTLEFIEPKIDIYGRLINQSGLFTKSKANASIESRIIDQMTSNDDENEKLNNDEDLTNELAKYICKIYIKNDEHIRKNCLNSLLKMNIHYANLLPDITGASKYCNFKIQMLKTP